MVEDSVLALRVTTTVQTKPELAELHLERIAMLVELGVEVELVLVPCLTLDLEQEDTCRRQPSGIVVMEATSMLFGAREISLVCCCAACYHFSSSCRSSCGGCGSQLDLTVARTSRHSISLGVMRRNHSVVPRRGWAVRLPFRQPSSQLLPQQIHPLLFQHHRPHRLPHLHLHRQCLMSRTVPWEWKRHGLL